VSTDVDTSRCPRCAALVRPGSQWCTLCYADLRPAPVALPPAAPQPATAVATHGVSPSGPGSGFDPLTAPLALLDQDGDEPPRGRHAAPERLAAPAAPAGWPCLKCGDLVAIDDSACPSCGAKFLENLDSDTSLHRLRLNTGQVSGQLKVLVMVGGSIGLLVVLLGLMYLVGMVF
jgi:RNA polymerase subunit RPABC4/transcription elongation factor Spt4